MVGLSMASGVLYNGTSTVDCFDIEKEFIECADPTGCGLGNDAAAWDYQVSINVNVVHKDRISWGSGIK